MAAKAKDPAPKKKRGPGRPWKKGQSGNPKGRAVGSRNKVTLACQKLLEGEAEALTRKIIEQALAGDQLSQKVCIERMVPKLKPRDLPVKVTPPEITTATDVARALSTVFVLVGKSKLTPDEAKSLSSIIAAQSKTIELKELEERITALEEKR